MNVKHVEQRGSDLLCLVPLGQAMLGAMREPRFSYHFSSRGFLATVLLLLVFLLSVPSAASAVEDVADPAPYHSAPSSKVEDAQVASSLLEQVVGSRVFHLSLFNQSVGFALGGGLLDAAVKPGILIGAEHLWAEGRRWRWLQTASIGYLRQRHVQHGIFAGTAIGGARGLIAGLSGEALLGIAYFHSFSERPFYDPASGDRLVEWGRPSLMPSLGLGLSWEFSGRAHPLSIFLRQEYLLQWPYAPGIGAALIPHTALHLGLRFRLDR